MKLLRNIDDAISRVGVLADTDIFNGITAVKMYNGRILLMALVFMSFEALMAPHRASQLT